MSLEEISDGADQLGRTINLYVMARPGNGDEFACWEFIAQCLGALVGEDAALGAADDEGGTCDAVGIGPGPAG